MSNKPSVPKGTRDFSPTEMARRNYIFDTIKKVYKKYGFQQIETPAMENLNTLIGTGGDESDTLIFKILNSGDYLSKADEKALTDKNSNGLTRSIAEKALRYDLTVPFARYVVQNQNDITFPFRRFQIQPVWRADRPQKGRYREFYQCDADIIGSDSLLNEVDLIKIIDDVFTELFQGNLNYTVSINNRKILQGLVETIEAQDLLEDIIIVLDKYDKIGEDGILQELKKLNLSESAINKLLELTIHQEVTDIFSIKERKDDTFLLLENQLEGLLSKMNNSINGEKGIEELNFIFSKLKQLNLETIKIKFDPTLARGLGYYTGTIIEVKVDNFPSICGGGRYDDLTGKFGLKDVSGVGISFGADRIYDVLLDNNLYPEFKGDSTEVLFTNQNSKDEETFLPMLFELRAAGINSEIYPDVVKWKRQMNFATRKNIKYIVSANESGDINVKNMETEERVNISSAKELVSLINK
jgi:histidyl-tRNA synthetase